MVSEAVPAAARRRGRLFTILLFTLFGAPVLVAWLLVGSWRPAGSVAHGELMDPPQPLDNLVLQGSAGPVSGGSVWAEGWNLVYRGGVECGTDCAELLHQLRQIHLALGRRMSRVQRLLVLTGEPAPDFAALISAEYPRLRVLTLADEALLRAPAVYLVDPLGNAFMRYPPDTEPRGILKDLERLLKLSKMG